MNKDSIAQNTLRAAAEARFCHAPVTTPVDRATEELLHELQVHQIELEMQIEELRRAHFDLDESRDRYIDLYDFSPVGYLTITQAGLIAEINLTATKLLGIDRRELLYRRFSAFVIPEDGDRWYLFFVGIIKHNQQKNIELTLKHSDGAEFPVQLNGLLVTSGDLDSKVRVTLTDITESRRAIAHLSEVEMNAALSLTNAEMGSWEWNIETGRIIFNEHWAKMRGYRLDEKERHFSDWENDIHPDDLQAYHAALTAHLENRSLFFQAEYRVRTQSGSWLWLLDRGAVIKRDTEGSPLRMAGIEMDISNRKCNEEKLRIAAIAFESQQGMFVTDANAVIMEVNQAFTRLTGYRAEEAIGQKPSMLSSGRHDQAFYRNMWEILKNKGFWQGDIWNRRKDGVFYAEWLNISTVCSPNGCISHYVASFTDITREKELYQLAYYDLLTLLPNRRLFQEHLAKALLLSDRSERYGALLFIDLDKFKALNDTLGHDMGDLLLTQTGARILNCIRKGDTVARLGGDEFVVILEELSPTCKDAVNQAKDVGEKIILALNQNYQLNHSHYHSTPSIGITLFNSSKKSMDDLVKQADIAMYAAKAAGRNTLRFFDSEMQATIMARAHLEADLIQALKNNQFKLYFQLQTTHDHRIIGAEVLLRWEHPERGLVSSLEFIPLAEETRLILPISLWVLETACAQLKSWESIPHTRQLQLAVNVSAHQFHEAGFVEQVCAVIEKHAIQPDRLKLELTETLVLDNIEDAITKMFALKKIGVCFSMDDFGTGYSSLAYLIQLPLDQLKIDQSFVHNIGVKLTDAVIVQTIIGMANNLGIDVIAEGVETEEQRVFLERHGCPAIQGYLFSKPVPIEQLELLLLAHKYP
ncbi:MAG: EAL domain-containing protein [Methylobacter sp.]|nr:EAL domain-containing protein [Candidatus Methylobacter titanis]